jgi:hypothetical protein
MATITLKCSGEGFGCHTKCDLPVMDTHHLHWFEENKTCPKCSEIITSSKCAHIQCGFEIILIMMANQFNVWEIFYRRENRIYHPEKDERHTFLSRNERPIIGAEEP